MGSTARAAGWLVPHSALRVPVRATRTCHAYVPHVLTAPGRTWEFRHALHDGYMTVTHLVVGRAGEESPERDGGVIGGLVGEDRLRHVTIT